MRASLRVSVRLPRLVRAGLIPAGLILALACGAPRAAQAAPIDDAYIAVLKRDYTAAMGLLLPLADQGDAVAQYTVGVIMDGGFGNAEQQSNDAPKWFRRAADQGHPEAQTLLAKHYVEGRGVPQDFGEARKLYLAAARKEIREARFGLAQLYSQGLGGPRDAGSAAALSHRAAEQGHRDAQHFLAGLYAAGDGVTQSHEESVRWFMRAAEQGHPDAQLSVAAAYRDGQGVAENLVLSYVWLSLASRNPELGAADAAEHTQMSSELERIAAHFPAEVRAEADRIIAKWKVRR